MKPGIIYRGIFVNIETDATNANVQQVCMLSIYDMETLIDDVDMESIIELEMTGEPIQIEVIDNSEDNFTPIRPKQLTAKIFSSDSIRISTFSEGGDNRYKVIYTTENETPFIGWLSISDLSQEFMPDPNVITLIAGDGLGFLKDIPLTDFDSNNPVHENRIMDYLAWIFSKTGLALNIVCCFNIREANAGALTSTSITQVSSFDAATDQVFTATINWFYAGQIVQVTGTASNNITFTVISVSQSIITFVFVDTPLTDEANVNATFTDITPPNATGHFFKQMWLEAKTGEDDIGTSINCFQWLTYILKEMANCYQDNGTWFIMRKDEYEFGKPYYLFTFDYQGTFISATQETFEKSIGIGLTLSWMNDNAQVSLERPAKKVTLPFDYLTPKEIPDNVDYDRGAVTTRVIEPGYTAYNLDGWAIGNLWGSATTLPTIDAVILRSFNSLSDEITRFVMFKEPPGTTGAFEYIRSSPIPVGFQDKFTWSFDVSAMTNPSGDGIVQVCFIVLYGSDGNVYILNTADTSETWSTANPNPTLIWHLTNAQLSLFRTGFRWAIFPDDVKTDWVNCSLESIPVPVDGEIRIFLFAGNQGGGVPSFKIRYQNFNFDYRAYIGGTYQKYKGQEHKVEGGTNTIAAREENIFVSDSPKRLFKGSLLKTNGETILFTGTVFFSSPNSLDISGYKVTLFDVGTKLLITGTNAGEYTITEVTYHLIGDTTQLTFREQTISAVSETATLSKYLFTLASQFYDASDYPNGDQPENIPYGKLQVFDVWNQYNRTMSKFDGTVDGLDTATVIPDLKYKYFLTDAGIETNSKMFQLLHFSHEKHLCEWRAFLHEVADSTIEKTYTGYTFKYIT